MLTKQRSLSNLKKSWSFLILVLMGIILNLVAALTDGNSALVAVGCSLIAIGVATNKHKSDKK